MSNKVYDLYGILYDDINFAKTTIENILRITMQAHDSLYLGEYFLFDDVGEEHFILQKNYNEFEDEWNEKTFSQYPLLLYVNETPRSEDLVKLLSKDEKIVFLTHQVI